MKMILEMFWAVVAASTGFLRSAPDYESSLDSQLLMGTVACVDKTQGYWCHVNAMEPAYSGWINDLQLSIKTEDQIQAYIDAPKYICTADFSHVFEAPSAGSGRICGIVMGEIVRRTGRSAGTWKEVLLPDDRTGWMESADVECFEEWARTRKPDAENLVSVASRFMGCTYMWGGASIKYVDCSGLVRNVYYMNGLLLPRDASQQVKLGLALPLDMSGWQVGDLLFFGTPASGGKPMRVSHVAMYIGNGRIIHSSKVVRVNSLVPGEPDYYERPVIAARRMLGQEGKDGGPVRIQECPWYFKQQK